MNFLSQVVSALILALIDRIYTWATQKKADQAQAQAVTTAVVVDSLKQQQATEAQIAQAEQAAVDAAATHENYQAKLDALQNRNLPVIKKRIIMERNYKHLPILPLLLAALLCLAGCSEVSRDKGTITDCHAQAYCLAERIGTPDAPTLEELQQYAKASSTAWQSLDTDVNGWTAIPGSIGMASTPVFSIKTPAPTTVEKGFAQGKDPNLDPLLRSHEWSMSRYLTNENGDMVLVVNGKPYAKGVYDDKKGDIQFFHWEYVPSAKIKRDLNDAWIDNMLAKARQPVTVRAFDGKTTIVNINQNIVDFISANRYELAVVGQAVFQDFLASVQQGNSYEALVKIYKAMPSRDLVNAFIANAVVLGDHSAQQAQVKSFWIDLVVGLMGKVEPTALSAILTMTGL